MSRNNHIINSFVAGEASPKFFGRTETQQYNQACEKLFNTIVHPQGGVSRRPGTLFQTEILRLDRVTPPDDARIFPFLGTDGTRWQIVITPHRPDPAGAYIPGVTETEWQAYNISTLERQTINCSFDTTYVAGFMANYYDLTAKSVPLLEIQHVQAGDTIFFAHKKIRPFKIQYDPDTSPKFTMTTVPDLTNALIDADEWRSMPFEPAVIQSTSNDEAINLAVSGGGLLTISPGSGSLVAFTGDWNGRIIKFTRDANAVVVVLVYDVDSASSAKCIQIGGVGPAFSTNKDYGGADPDDYYEIGQWDDEAGWPATVTFFESRLVYGGSKTYPDRLWFSQINDIAEFDYYGLVTDAGYTDPVAADDPFAANLKSNVLTEIRWMSAGKTLTVGTNFREFIVQGGNPQLSIGPTNFQSSAETPYGSAYVQAVRIENTAVFLQRHRRALRELVYNFDEDSFKASNLNIIAEHIVKTSAYRDYAEQFSREEAYLVQMVMMECPDGIMWALDNNGALCAMTREREQQVNAWHYHEIAGEGTVPFFVDPAFVDVPYKPQVKSLSVIQKPSIYADGAGGEPDELWMTVARGIGENDGSGGVDYVLRFYLEKMAQEWDGKNIESGWNTSSVPRYAPVYMDCAYLTDYSREVTTNGNANGIIGPLPHGSGQTVAVVIDGKYLGERLVDVDGMLDLTDDIDVATDLDWQMIIGFNYTNQIIPVVAETPAQLGSSQAQPRRIDQITIHFYRTCGAYFGRATSDDQENTPSADLEQVEFPTEDDSPIVPMFTGEKKLNFPEGYEQRPRILVEGRIPLPMHVTHIVARQVVYE